MLQVLAVEQVVTNIDIICLLALIEVWTLNLYAPLRLWRAGVDFKTLEYSGACTSTSECPIILFYLGLRIGRFSGTGSLGMWWETCVSQM